MAIIRNEKQVYARLKAKWPEAHWQRIEDALATGVPDTNAHIPCDDHVITSIEVWLESKVAKPGLAGHITVDLHPQQRAWLKRRSNAGGTVYVAWALRDKVYLCPGVSLIYIKNKDLLITWLHFSTELSAFTLEPI